MTGDLDIRFEETAKGGRYFMVMPNGEQSRLTFVKVSPAHIIADHTFVPPPYRNNGVGEAMVERLIRTLKEQCAHRHRFETLQHASRVIGDWISLLQHSASSPGAGYEDTR